MTVVLANGTLLTASPASHPHLFKSLGVSVGRLGVVTELTLRIKPQMAVTKSLQELRFKQFADQIKARLGWWCRACWMREPGRSVHVLGQLRQASQPVPCQQLASDNLWRDFTPFSNPPAVDPGQVQRRQGQG